MASLTKEQTLAYLDAHGIPYELTEHEAVFNMAEIAEVCLPHPEWDAKNLFVRDDKKRGYYLITLRGDKRVDLEAFREAQGLRRLSFASAADLGTMLGLTPGSVTPLGLLNDEEHRVRLYLDNYFAGETIGVHPNDNTATVWLRTDDLVRLLRDAGTEVEVVEV